MRGRCCLNLITFGANLFRKKTLKYNWFSHVYTCVKKRKVELITIFKITFRMTWQQCKLVTACYVLNHSKWSNKWSKHSTNGTSLDDKFANLLAQESIFFTNHLWRCLFQPWILLKKRPSWFSKNCYLLNRGNVPSFIS